MTNGNDGQRDERATLATWLAGWLEVRQGIMSRIDARARQDKRFVRRYAELDVEGVDAALKHLAELARELPSD